LRDILRKSDGRFDDDLERIPSRLGRFDYERDWIAHHLSAPRGQNEIAQGRALGSLIQLWTNNPKALCNLLGITRDIGLPFGQVGF